MRRRFFGRCCNMRVASSVASIMWLASLPGWILRTAWVILSASEVNSCKVRMR